MLLRGANSKAKANAAQGIPEMLLIANEREFEKNRKDKHSKNAKYGWYSYVTRIVFIRHYENKKRNVQPFPVRRPYSVTKPISFLSP